jgi:hypothetical protein
MSGVTTALEATRRRESASPWSSPVIVTVVVSWITTVLVLDAESTRWLQRGLGLATWCVLAVIVSRESALVRVQTAIVVVFASIIELTFSPLLGVYVYRFHNVPMYVPPGHGLVYLAALAIGRTRLVSTHTALCSRAALLVVGAYAALGLVVAARPDVLGAFWFLCLGAFMRWGPSPGLYVGACLVVTYLELAGTRLGTWTWQPHDPTGLVSIGNPPSGAAGGYGWFDLAALVLAPALLSGVRRLSRPRRRRPLTGGGARPRSRDRGRPTPPEP